MLDWPLYLIHMSHIPQKFDNHQYCKKNLSKINKLFFPKSQQHKGKRYRCLSDLPNGSQPSSPSCDSLWVTLWCVCSPDLGALNNNGWCTNRQTNGIIWKAVLTFHAQTHPGTGSRRSGPHRSLSGVWSMQRKAPDSVTAFFLVPSVWKTCKVPFSYHVHVYIWISVP